MQKIFWALFAGLVVPFAVCSDGVAEDSGISKQKGNCKKKVGKRMNKLVSFSFHQSGGFMGMDRQYEAKLSELSAQDRENLERLIGESGLLEAKSGEKFTRGAADMFVYEFSADDGAAHTVTFDDGTLPDSYRPLVEYLRDKLVDNRKR